MKVTQAVLDDIKRTTDQWRASDEKRDSGLPTEFPDVKRYDNISYGPAGEENLLDVYTPKDVTQSVPTIIDIHGGGTYTGPKSFISITALVGRDMDLALLISIIGWHLKPFFQAH